MVSPKTRRILLSSLAFGLLVCLQSAVQAQGLFGSNSPTNGQNGRSTASSGARGSTSGATGSQMELGGLNSGGLGNGNLGAGGGTQSGMGSRTQGNMRGSTAGGRFVGMRQAGQAAQMPNANGMLNGRNNRTGANQFGQQGQFGQQNRNNQNRNRNQQGQQGMRQNFNGQSQAQGRQIRPSLKVGFEFDPAEVAPAHNRLASRIDKLNDRKQFQGVDMRTEGDTVVLRGVVKDAATKRLMERMAALDPAIKSIRNELEVTGDEKETN